MKFSDNSKILIVLYYRHRSTIKKDKLKNSNASQVIESDSSSCNFRDALIAPVKGLFHGIHFFAQQTVSILLPFVYQVDPYFVKSIDMCSTNEKTKTGIYIQKKALKNYSLSLKSFGYFFSF